MTKVFLDSDVILDYFYLRKPFFKSATKLIDLCANKKIKGLTSPIIIANLYYILRKNAKHDYVLTKIKELLEFICVLEMNQKIVLEALNSDFKDFEYALQNYAVENTEIKIIITRNVKDYKKSKLSVYTPNSFLKTLSND